MKKLKALLLTGVMICSAGALASCSAKKPTDGTYHATWENRFYLSDVDGKIKISNGGADIYFEDVYVNYSAKSGNATVSNVREYNQGNFYWLADYMLEVPVYLDGRIFDYKEYLGVCAASENGKTLYIGGNERLNGYCSYKK